MSDSNSKPRVLVLGGSGFIGRNMVEFLVKNDLVSKVRAVDKVPPQMAWMNQNHQDIFNNPIVEFKSANLINPSSCQAAFQDPDHGFDFVVNCAAETKCGQSDPVYKEGIVKLSVNCAREAAKQKVKRYVEISSGHMYSSEKTAVTERSKTEPWTFMAKHKLKVEEELEGMTDLDYVFLRPANVYGIADKQGITPRLVIGAVYQHLGEMMKLLWNKDLKMHTVHISDMCRAIWYTLQNGKPRETYNIVDKGDTTQGRISDIISEIFNINHDYWGTSMSTLAKVDMNSVVDEINDKHMGPWAEACSRDGIVNTPLNPYLTQEQLRDKHLNLDGSKLESLGFQYLTPNITKEKVKEIVDDYIVLGLFPQLLNK